MKILAIESSCDETAAAVVEDGKFVLSSIVASQIEEHKKFGGVVPEIASRCHCENITGIVKEALSTAKLSIKEIDGIAVTYAPGLIGALLVGVNFAKALSFALNIPLIPVHHIRAHIASNYIIYPELKPPFLCLVASGGHSHIIEVLDYTEYNVIGRTRDDAAGEAYDKAGRVLGFPYPAGVYMDKAAQEGDPYAYKLPRPVVEGAEFDFSFSGLKTAVINTVHNAGQKGHIINNNDMAAAFQLAVCDIFSLRLMAAAEKYGYKDIALAGGVAANSGLRARLSKECSERGYNLYLPDKSLCGDNAAMVGVQAYYEYLNGNIAEMDLNASAAKKI